LLKASRATAGGQARLLLKDRDYHLKTTYILRGPQTEGWRVIYRFFMFNYGN
jgi:hypothetical protein